MSKDKNPKTGTEKTQDIEEATIETDPKTLNFGPVEQMDEIIRNNDKFETVKVIMEILCKELGIPKDSQLDVVGRELNKVWEAYWKSIQDWRELTTTADGKRGIRIK